MLILAAGLGLGIVAVLISERDRALGRFEAAAFVELRPGEDGGTTMHDASVTWKFDPTDSALVAAIEIGERRETIDVTFRPNTDADFDASHIVEIRSANPYPGRKIVAVTGLYVKQQRSEAGRLLIGTPVAVSDDLHWFVMSGVPQDRRANLNLLAQANILQLNVQYENGAQAALAFEKGSSGAAAFEQAFAAWERQTP